MAPKTSIFHVRFVLMHEAPANQSAGMHLLLRVVVLAAAAYAQTTFSFANTFGNNMVRFIV